MVMVWLHGAKMWNVTNSLPWVCHGQLSLCIYSIYVLGEYCVTISKQNSPGYMEIRKKSSEMVCGVCFHIPVVLSKLAIDL